MNRFLLVLSALLFPLATAAADAPRSLEYDAVQTKLARGWNTWDTHSVAAQVLLPEGFTVRVGFKHNSSLNSDAFLADSLIGRHGLHNENAEQVFPGPHTWNGSYTELRLAWQGHELLLQTAHDGEDLVMLASPLASKGPLAAPYLAASFQEAIGVSTGRPRSVGQIRAILDRERPASSAGSRAIETVVGWDTIYELSLIHISEPTRPY